MVWHLFMINQQEFEKKVNPESVVWQNVETDYWKENLKNFIKEHHEEYRVLCYLKK